MSFNRESVDAISKILSMSEEEVEEYNRQIEKLEPLKETLEAKEKQAEEEIKIFDEFGMLTNFDTLKPNVQKINIAPDEINEQKIGVYIKVNEADFVTRVESDVFIDDADGFIKIDEGYGEKFAHAQSQYFGKSLIDDNGEYVIKYNP